MLCFRYFLCSIGFLSSSKIIIIMYFGHRFPLTSHIRGHLLSIWMEPLYPSANIPHVGTQKDIYGLRFAHNIIDWLTIIHFSSIQLVTLPFFYVELYSRLSLYATRESFVSVGWCKSRMDVFAGCSYSKLWIIRGLSFYIPANRSLNI